MVKDIVFYYICQDKIYANFFKNPFWLTSSRFWYEIDTMNLQGKSHQDWIHSNNKIEVNIWLDASAL